jgi:hypothetical protein
VDALRRIGGRENDIRLAVSSPEFREKPVAVQAGAIHVIANFGVERHNRGNIGFRPAGRLGLLAWFGIVYFTSAKF